jgi:hypothetical protein
MLRPTVSRPGYLGIKHPSGAYDQIFITCVTVAERQISENRKFYIAVITYNLNVEYFLAVP